MNLEALESKYADLRQQLEDRGLLVEIEVDRNWLTDRLQNLETALRCRGDTEEEVSDIVEKVWLVIVLGVQRKG